MHTPPPDLVFVSYCHRDRHWLRRLMVLLAPVVRNRRLEPWADEHIQAGEDWRRDIHAAVGRARLAVCLVTGDFLNSRFIMDEELPALRAAGVPIVPVLVHECLWQEDPHLAGVQWAHDPGQDGPLDRHNDREGERDRRLTAVCRRILELLPPTGATPAAAPVGVPAEAAGYGTGRAWAGAGVALRAGTGGPGRIDGVPSLPSGYLARDDELGGLRAAVLADRAAAVGLTGQVAGLGLAGLGLAGQGGIGKSVLAAALARDEQVGRSFPDGIYWVGLGADADPLAAQRTLLRRLGVADAEVRSVAQGAQALREALADRQCLLVVDDVWSAAAAKALAVTGPRGRVVYTTRDAGLLGAVGARIEHVDVLSDELARGLLARLSGTRVDEFPGEVSRVLAGTRRVALALALVGAAVRGGASWPRVAAELDRGERVFGAHPYANTFKALQLALTTLDKQATELYLSLAVFPADTLIPLPAIVRYWQRLRGESHTAAQARAQLGEFAGRELLAVDGEHAGFHDLQHDYLLLQADDLDLRHADLLGAYRDLLPARDQWWQLPPDEPYLWEHLIHHLHGAGETAELARTVTDPAYLITRTHLHGPAAAEADLRRTANLLTNPDLDWWQQWFGHYGHLIADLPTRADTAATAALRLAEAPPSVDAGRLTALRAGPYLTHRWGLTPAPQNLRRVLTGHQGRVNAVAFSPDGHQLATASPDGTTRIWNTTTGEHTTLTSHHRGVNAVALSPDGHHLATASPDGTTRIWNTTTGEHTLTSHHRAVNAVAFSPDGHHLATTSDDGTTRIWNTTTGQHTTLTGHHGRVRAVAFSPDGHHLATASNDGTARIWNTTTGEHTTLTGHQDWVRAVAFSPDGHHLATASNDRTARIWNTTTGEHTTLTGHHSAVSAVAFSPDGHHLATASTDGTVRIWDQSKTIRTMRLGLQVNDVCWHADLLGIAVDSSVVVLRITGLPGC